MSESALEPQVRHVLVVDDDQEICSLARRILKGAGFTVHTAENGEAAVGILRSMGAWHAVVTDREMPVMDGFELARRAHELYPALPVLMMTARPQRIPKEFLAELDGYLPKPFKDANNLLEALQAASEARANKVKRGELAQTLRDLGAARGAGR